MTKERKKGDIGIWLLILIIINLIIHEKISQSHRLSNIWVTGYNKFLFKILHFFQVLGLQFGDSTLPPNVYSIFKKGKLIIN